MDLNILGIAEQGDNKHQAFFLSSAKWDAMKCQCDDVHSTVNIIISLFLVTDTFQIHSLTMKYQNNIIHMKRTVAILSFPTPT